MNREAINRSDHVVPFRTYVIVGGILLFLTALTFYCSTLPLGGWNAVVAISIATVKGTLVAFIFMHLWYDRKYFLIIFAIGIIFLGILISLTMFDVLERGAVYENQAGPIRKEAVIYHTGEAKDSAAVADSVGVPDSVGRVTPTQPKER